MANCGKCGSSTICSCVVSDSASVTVHGDGSSFNPFTPYIVGYPNPRPTGIITGQPFIAKNSETVLVATFGNVSIPSMWTGGTKLIAPLAGTYILALSTHTNVTDACIAAKIRLNGSTIIAARMNKNFSFATPSGQTAAGTLTSIYTLAANDYIEAVAWSALFIEASNQVFFGLEMRWMGF